ncbi:uroplakin-3b [Siphateles boraxobius]|uniref:uroplakin-3b n=1 Tax=Siphateles boraxobius TaxID=180520 RepID=UPI004062A93D
MRPCYKMNTNAVIRLMSLLSIWMWTGQGVTFQPQLSSSDLPGKITSNTVMLKQPHCVFDELRDGHEIWLIVALNSATGVVDGLVTDPNILNVSPYPTAFDPQPSKNFFVTKVGSLADFPCSQSSDDLYFRVGAEGKCTGTNCNGILPDGSIVSFRYLLVDGNHQNIVIPSDWLHSVFLKTKQDPQGINDGLSARSGAMVVITTILCVAAALLLLLFFIMLCVAYCGRKDISQGTSPMRFMNSIRIPRYDTHSLRGQAHPYDNPGYMSEVKNYSTSETLPKSGIQTQKL